MAGTDETIERAREAFSLLGHDLRLEILLSLLDGWEAAHTDPRRFSELMRAVDVRDSGKFNYHLDKLRGAYLRKTDGGYVPTAAATALYRAVLAHRPTEAGGDSELVPGADCPDCGEPLVATYERAFFTLRCPGCDSPVGGFTYPLPGNALGGRTDGEALDAVYDRARSQIGLARRGQCPDCAGPTTVEVRRAALDAESGGDDPPVGISCDTCTWMVRTGFLLPLLSDARVAAALVGLGVPVERAYPWELPEVTANVVTEGAGSGSDREVELELELLIEADGGTATVSVDGDLGVHSVAGGGRDDLPG